MEQIPWIVIGAEILRQDLRVNRAIEHPTQGNAIHDAPVNSGRNVGSVLRVILAVKLHVQHVLVSRSTEREPITVVTPGSRSSNLCFPTDPQNQNPAILLNP